MDYENLSCREMLKEIRKRLNITQKTLAKKLKISRGYLSEIEIGAKKPSTKLRLKIKLMHLKCCLFEKNQPLVEVMIPEQPKKSLLKRIVDWFRK